MILSITSLNYWLLSLALCLGLWGCAWSLSVAKRRRKESGDITPIVTVSEQFKQKARTTLANTAKIGLGMALGVLLGMGIREHQLIKNTHTYIDVLVMERYSADKYLLRPARMQPWISKTCEAVDLSAGHTMKFYTFEQMPDCHRVKAFEFYANSKGERINASIQMR
jgi:hypothetical protein